MTKRINKAMFSAIVLLLFVSLFISCPLPVKEIDTQLITIRLSEDNDLSNIKYFKYIATTNSEDAMGIQKTEREIVFNNKRAFLDLQIDKSWEITIFGYNTPESENPAFTGSATIEVDYVGTKMVLITFNELNTI